MSDANGDERRWLTVEEAGALAGIARSTAYDAVNRGDIPSIRVGRLIRVPRKKWLAILDGDHLSPYAERPGQGAGPSEEHS